MRAKLLFAWGGLALLACASDPTSPAAKGAQVATVNGEAIAREPFEAAVERNLRRFGDAGKDLERTTQGRIQESVLAQLIEEALVAQKAQALGIDVQGDELDAILAQHRERFRSPESYRDYLSRANSSEAMLRDDLRKSLLADRVIDRLGGNVTIAAEDIQAHYQSNAEHFMQPERMRLHRLWLPLAANASANEEARTLKRMRHLRARCRAQPFEAVSRASSQAPEAQTGGDMGLVLAGRYAELDRAVKAGLEPGELSEPMKVDGGVAVFRLDAHEARGPRPLSQVEAEIRTTLTIKLRNQRRQAVLRQLREGAEVRQLVAFDTGVKRPAAPSASAPAVPASP